MWRAGNEAAAASNGIPLDTADAATAFPGSAAPVPVPASAAILDTYQVSLSLSLPSPKSSKHSLYSSHGGDLCVLS